MFIERAAATYGHTSMGERDMLRCAPRQPLASAYTRQIDIRPRQMGIAITIAAVRHAKRAATGRGFWLSFHTGQSQASRRRNFERDDDGQDDADTTMAIFRRHFNRVGEQLARIDIRKLAISCLATCRARATAAHGTTGQRSARRSPQAVSHRLYFAVKMSSMHHCNAAGALSPTGDAITRRRRHDDFLHGDAEKRARAILLRRALHAKPQLMGAGALAQAGRARFCAGIGHHGVLFLDAFTPASILFLPVPCLACLRTGWPLRSSARKRLGRLHASQAITSSAAGAGATRPA